nr:hypothetical protein L204_01004 [Cryptococcus depauperatus CBS 7855]
MSRAATPTYQVRRPGNASTNSAGPSTRAGTPVRPAVISLDEWEKKARLGKEQLESIVMVKERFGERSLPEKFTNQSSRPSTPKGKSLSTHLGSSTLSHPPSVPGTPVQKDPGGLGSIPSHLASHLPDPLHPASIATPQQFLDHFTALTLSTEHEQDSFYRDHLSEINGLREKCESLIGLLRGSEEEVKEMGKCLSYVEERSESLRGACEDLLEEQNHLLTHTSQIAHRLTFFTFLETATRILNNPGNNLVLDPDFLPMVKRLEECIGYLEDHRDFRDAELYLIRYQQCLTRSMTLIKLHFVGAMKNLGQEIKKRMTDQARGLFIIALVYTKFISLSATLRPLLAELEQRVLSNPDELGSLLTGCHSVYVDTRQGLIGNRVNEEIIRMDPTGSALIDFTRFGCSYLKQTCLDEFNLFKHFFLSGERTLYGFLEGLCDYLYDHLRPRILHEPSLQILCGVCTVLQALMVQDISDDDDNDTLNTPSEPASPFDPMADDYFSSKPRLYRSGSSKSTSYPNSMRQVSNLGPSRSMNDSMSVSPGTVALPAIKTMKRKPLSRLHLEVLLKMVLQDAQTRLVFRAQALLSAEVEYYVPKEGDVNYPEKLKQGRLLGLSGDRLIPLQAIVSLNGEDDDESTVLELPPPEMQESWYPSLRIALWIISCLRTYVDAAVFDDLAQDAVTMCRRSLSSASDLILAQKGKDKSVDSKLFLVRHLLILKEMTAGLELGKAKRKDWSGIGDFLRSLLDNASSFLGYQRGSATRPDFAADARTDIDRALKAACEDLISIVTASATSSLRQFLDQCTVYITKSSSGASKSDLSSEYFATSDKVKQVHEEFKQLSQKELAIWKKELRLYLLDEETVGILVPPALNSIVDVYRKFHDMIRAEYDFSTAAGIMTPSGVMHMLQKVE